MSAEVLQVKESLFRRFVEMEFPGVPVDIVENLSKSFIEVFRNE